MSFSNPYNLPKLNGTNGFIIHGGQSYFGSSVSITSDINGDGINDVIVSDPSSLTQKGSTYVMFGSRSTISTDIYGLNGSNGFRIKGVSTSDNSGSSLSGAGDINGDGIDDIIIGAPGKDVSYVVFGSKSTFPANFELSNIDGTNGFAIVGNNGLSGNSVSGAGDINGDGIDDIIIGTRGAPVGGYVVFGSKTIFPEHGLSFSALNGTNGFVINGIVPNGILGSSVSGLGDINGDGIDDVIIRAIGDDTVQSTSYVVFGNTSFSAMFDLSTLDGNNGFIIKGLSNSDKLVSENGAGDINSDGINDIIIGGFNSSALMGASYVIFGSNTTFPSVFNIYSLNGTNGFTMHGVADGDQFGFSVSSAGDVNDDNIDDIIIGAPGANNNYIIFGKSVFPSVIKPSELNGTDGFILNGYYRDIGGKVTCSAGYSVNGAGDVNGDGIGDLVVGAPGCTASVSYVVFGPLVLPSHSPIPSPSNDYAASNINIPNSLLSSIYNLATEIEETLFTYDYASILDSL
ncbi:FG-GAP repeat protein [Holosporaceae bacterium 'Namur']|nr:FG-GAP repeat protein [Holosporaceae bacterium 'Namur']